MVILKPTHPDDWMKNDGSIIQEMAVPRKDMARLLGQWHSIIYRHLLKLFYFRENLRDFNGWSISVWKCMSDIPELKGVTGKNKWPDAQFIYNNMWGCYEDAFFDGWHKGTLKDFNYKGDPEFSGLPYVHAGGNVETAGEFIKEYHIWLAKELSKKGKVSKGDVQDKIKELLDKYPYQAQ